MSPAQEMELGGIPLKAHDRRIVGGIRHLDREFGDHGAAVSIPKLREALGAKDKDSFDRAVLDSASRGVIDLHRHDYPAGLSPQEKEGMILDKSTGQFYIGAALSEATQKPLPQPKPPAKKDIRGRYVPARKSQQYQHGPRTL